ncbi:MAG: hypothetical protein JXJ17_05820 [Anaerolineae bacterium]|nr:hypothetical protein [Anaerolineae bacterium]
MGTFLSIAELYVGESGHKRRRDQVITTLSEVVAKDTRFEAVDNPADADRTIYIGPADRWIVVADTFASNRDIAQMLSEKFATSALSTEVADSDVAFYMLYENGNLIDEYNSRPGIYDEEPEERYEELRGKPELWEHLLLPDFTTDDLRKVWDSRPLFAEDIVWQTAKMIGGKPFDHEPNACIEQCAQLYFRYTGQRPHEQKAEGPPKFELSSYGMPEVMSVGETMLLHVSANNQGDASKGLSIVVLGSLVDQGCVQAVKARISHCDTNQEYQFESLTTQIDEREAQIRRILLPDFEIQVGRPRENLTQEEYHLFGMTDFRTKLHEAVSINLSVEAIKPGSGELYVVFIPFANPESGQAVYHTEMEISSTPRKPLKYAERGEHFESALMRALRDMESDRQFFVMAIFSEPAEVVNEDVASLIVKWHEAVGGDHPLMASISSERPSLPDERAVLPEELAQLILNAASLSDRWKIDPDFTDTDQEFGPPIGSDHAGYSFYRRTFSAEKKTAPHLILWVDTRTIDDKLLERLRELIIVWMDDFARKGWLLQAYCTAWRDAPWMIESTPYELACDIHGQVTTTIDWCSRFLRIVSERIWLGADLLERIPDRDLLKNIASVTELGDAARTELNLGSTLNQLEEALENILPTGEDWAEVKNQLLSDHSIMRRFMKRQ